MSELTPAMCVANVRLEIETDGDADFVRRRAMAAERIADMLDYCEERDALYLMACDLYAYAGQLDLKKAQDRFIEARRRFEGR